MKKSNKKFIPFAFIFISSILITLGCSVVKKETKSQLECSNYKNCDESLYILPFLLGEKHKVIQGNCAPNKKPWTHYGNLRYAYDFEMPIGTPIIAAYSGTVLFVRDEFTDNDHGKNQGNAIVILQEDGTYALYAHLTHKGSKVKIGQIVKQGDIIALSGNSGESPIPHLHFQVNTCGDFSKCESIPVSFNNVYPKKNILLKDEEYEAKVVK
ncbi:MAG: M23 family metallopeptidase [Paludibacteraceae bacterium]|nr:M23 family metallopeptidase [Paludibacteraceae bacterium]MBN2787461.1 M23 family metallopeptidase [Paludibacteraceae bacterium]